MKQLIHTDDTDRALLDEIFGRWLDRNKKSLTVLVIENAEAGDGSLATLLADAVDDNGGTFPGDFDELASLLDTDILTEMAHAATCELLDRVIVDDDEPVARH
jgi:hypothetical protein